MLETECTTSNSPFVFDVDPRHDVIRQLPTFDLTKIRVPSDRTVKSPSSDDDEGFLTPAICRFQKMSFDNL